MEGFFFYPTIPMTTLSTPSLSTLPEQGSRVDLNPKQAETISIYSVEDATRSALERVFKQEKDSTEQRMPTVTLSMNGKSIEFDSPMAVMEYACALNQANANNSIATAIDEYWRQRQHTSPAQP